MFQRMERRGMRWPLHLLQGRDPSLQTCCGGSRTSSGFGRGISSGNRSGGGSSTGISPGMGLGSGGVSSGRGTGEGSTGLFVSGLGSGACGGSPKTSLLAGGRVAGAARIRFRYSFEASSSNITATSELADRRTLLPSTSATSAVEI